MRKKRTIKILVTIIMLLGIHNVFSQEVLDQYQVVTPSGGQPGTSLYPAQGFVAGISGSLTRLDFYGRAITTPLTVTFDIREGAINGPIVSTATTGNISTTDMWQAITMTPISDVVAGNTYWIVMKNSSPTYSLFYKYSNDDTSYPNADYYDVWGTYPNQDSVLRNKDIAFKTYVVASCIDKQLPIAAEDSVICSSDSTNIQLSFSEQGAIYRLRNDANDVQVGDSIIGTGGTINFPTGILTSTTTYNITGSSFNSFGLEFDGVDDYVEIPHDVYRIPSNKSMTVNFWIYLEDTVSDMGIVAYGDPLTSSGGWDIIYREANNELLFTTRFSGNVFDSIALPINYQEWTQVTFVLEKQVEMRSYKDGVLSNTVPIPGLEISINNFGTYHTRLGKNDRANPLPNFMGKIDEFSEWKKSHNDSEVLSLMTTAFNGGEEDLQIYSNMNDDFGTTIFTDYSTNNYDGVLINMNSTTSWFDSDILRPAGCELELNELPTVYVNNLPVITVDSIQKESCFGEADGVGFLSVAGNGNNFSYDWDFDGVGDNDDLEDQTGLSVGTHNILVTDTFGCSSSTSLIVPSVNELLGVLSSTICNEESVVVNGTTYDAGNPTGTEVFTGVGPNSCDSTVTVNLTVLPALTGSVTTTICNEESVVVNGTTYDAGNPTGTEVFTGVGPNSCDSTVTVNLNVLPALTGSVTTTICNEESVVVNGTTYDAGNPTGTEVFTGVGPSGCDSTVTISLTVLPAIDVTVTDMSPTLMANESGAAYQWLDCNNGNTVISGEINQNYTAAMNGSYAVEITQSGCVDTSTCINLTTVGISELSTPMINLYPNPVKNQLIIALEQNVDIQVTIVTVEGKLIYSSTEMSKRKLTIDTSHWDKGIYFVRLNNEKIHQIHKVIK